MLLVVRADADGEETADRKLCWWKNLQNISHKPQNISQKLRKYFPQAEEIFLTIQGFKENGNVSSLQNIMQWCNYGDISDEDEKMANIKITTNITVMWMTVFMNNDNSD